VNGQRTSWYFVYFFRHLFIECQFYRRVAQANKKASDFSLDIRIYPVFVFFDKYFKAYL